MLTESLLFSNVAESNPNHIRDLPLHERARLRMSPFFLLAWEIKSLPNYDLSNDPDKVQNVFL